MSFVLTWNNPAGMRYVSLNLEGATLGILVISLLVILVSWIMAEGYKLREEQQLTI